MADTDIMEATTEATMAMNLTTTIKNETLVEVMDTMADMDMDIMEDTTEANMNMKMITKNET